MGTTAYPHLSKHRIEALVDGIFAVAMTLLVIELRLPEQAHIGSDAELRAALLHLLPNFFSWLMSFVVLALFWVANHRVYSHVQHVDAPLVWYTVVMLGGASLLPFASAVNGQYASPLAQSVYALVILIMALGSWLVARHIHKHPALCGHPMDRGAYRRLCMRSASVALTAVLTVPLAIQLPGTANLAFCLLLALHPLDRLLARRQASPKVAPA